MSDGGADDTAPTDIRRVGDDAHWDTFEELWTGLMSYRYLNKTVPELDAGHEDELESMPVRHDMRNPHGGIMAAPLAIVCPEPAWTDDEVIPAPIIASTQIIDDARGVEKFEVLREVINFGRTMGFMRSKVVDAADHSRVIAVSAGMGVNMGTPPHGFEPMENPPIQVEDHPDMPRLHEVFGCTRGDDGFLRLPELRQDQSAPHAALHLGPIHIIMDAAAHEAAWEFAGTDALQVENWYVMFVKGGVAGPFRCETSVISGSSGKINVDLTLRDEGKDDRIITTGSAIFSRI